MSLRAPQIEDILSFWFDPYARRHWFKSTDEFDAHIRTKYEPTCLALAAASLLEIDTPEEGLATLICLDQFPRNMYRDTAASFAWDAKAVLVAQDMVDKNWDVRIAQDRRQFIYLPFMHSENLKLQNQCIDLIDRRIGDENILKFAHLHKNIIQEFGRFPHRNYILNRASTPQEDIFLKNWQGFVGDTNGGSSQYKE